MKKVTLPKMQVNMLVDLLKDYNDNVLDDLETKDFIEK